MSHCTDPQGSGGSAPLPGQPVIPPRRVRARMVPSSAPGGWELSDPGPEETITDPPGDYDDHLDLLPGFTAWLNKIGGPDNDPDDDPLRAGDDPAMPILFSAAQAIVSMLAHQDADHAELRAAWQLAGRWENRAAVAADVADTAALTSDPQAAVALARCGIWSLAARELRAALQTDV